MGSKAKHQDVGTELYYLQSRYYDPTTSRFINADVFAATGQGLLGNNMFAYCGNNPIARIDSTGYIYVINNADLIARGGGADVGLGLFFPFVWLLNTIDALVGTASLPSKAVSTKEEEKVGTDALAITKNTDEPVRFPASPTAFNPLGLTPVPRVGSINGPIITWMDLQVNIAVFRWDSNPNHHNGPHYHVVGFDNHFYPGDLVPEPYATMYFPHK